MGSASGYRVALGRLPSPFETQLPYLHSGSCDSCVKHPGGWLSSLRGTGGYLSGFIWFCSLWQVQKWGHTHVSHPPGRRSLVALYDLFPLFLFLGVTRTSSGRLRRLADPTGKQLESWLPLKPDFPPAFPEWLEPFAVVNFQ